ncbi:GAF domain-containing protein [Pseudoblastomonas halimionae]|uniref:GAF domain-containing protein n=1 Tax=Alteriqipengyuania halimionae TaxID=1926630 RepID=A0A6I4TYQ5_9SPHN|nr:GAF domain-containing protein [Alteriqipengyuania halimionae]
MLQIRSDENARLAALASYDILNTEVELPFDRIVRLVRKLLDVPMATVSFVDEDRQWFKAKRGIAMQKAERKAAICGHTIRSREPLVVADLRKNPRFADLPHIRAKPPILSYLGAAAWQKSKGAPGWRRPLRRFPLPPRPAHRRCARRGRRVRSRPRRSSPTP